MTSRQNPEVESLAQAVYKDADKRPQKSLQQIPGHREHACGKVIV